MNKKLSVAAAGFAVLGFSAAYLILRKIKSGIFHAVSYDGKFELCFNGQWSLLKKNELNPNSNLEIVNGAKGICLIMFSEKKSDFNFGLEEYDKTLTDEMEDEIFSRKIVFISKKKAYLTEFDSNYKDTKIRYCVYTLETENYYHRFMAASINKDYGVLKHRGNIVSINGILGTLREAKGNF